MANLIIDELTRLNRGYNLMYALGAESGSVNLTSSEAEHLIQAARETAMGMRTTELHREIAAKVKPAMLRYVATGLMVGGAQ